MKMEYNHKKIQEGMHELMKMRVGDLEESVNKTKGTENISTPEVINFMEDYEKTQEFATDIINVSPYVIRFTKILMDGVKNLKMPKDKDYSQRKLNSFELSGHASNSLTRMHLYNGTVEDLAKKTEIDVRCVKGVGDKTVQRFKQILTEGGLDFRDYRK